MAPWTRWGIGISPVVCLLIGLASAAGCSNGESASEAQHHVVNESKTMLADERASDEDPVLLELDKLELEAMSCAYGQLLGRLVEEVPKVGWVEPLPVECFRSPARDDCSFYSKCFEARFRCSQFRNDFKNYVGQGGFAPHYCGEFSNLRRGNQVSERGRRWISDTMYCLQRNLQAEFHDNACFDGVFFKRRGKVPAPWGAAPACEYISQTGFEGHADCYTQPNGRMRDGLCELSRDDILRVSGTVLDFKSAATRERLINQFGYQGWLLLLENGAETFLACAQYHLNNKEADDGRRELFERLASEYRHELQIASSIDSRAPSLAHRILRPGFPTKPYPAPVGELIIPARTTFVVRADSTMALERLVIEDGARIRIENGAILRIYAEDASIGDDVRIIGRGDDGPPPPAPWPSMPQAGEGIQGASGKHGRAGISGTWGALVELRLGLSRPIGSVEVDLRGGAGGDAQDGQHGQMGGGGDCSGHRHPFYGGRGGDAGHGGYGGDGGMFRLFWWPNASAGDVDPTRKFRVTVAAGRGGKHARPGNGGPPGESRARRCTLGRSLRIKGTPGRHGTPVRDWAPINDPGRPGQALFKRVSDTHRDAQPGPYLKLALATTPAQFVQRLASVEQGINERGANGDTALAEFALSSGIADRYEKFEALLDAGADPTIAAASGLTPIQILIDANEYRDQRLLELIAERLPRFPAGSLARAAGARAGIVELIATRGPYDPDEIIEAFRVAEPRRHWELRPAWKDLGEHKAEVLERLIPLVDGYDLRRVLDAILELDKPVATAILLRAYPSVDDKRRARIVPILAGPLWSSTPSQQHVEIALESQDSDGQAKVWAHIEAKVEKYIDLIERELASDAAIRRMYAVRTLRVSERPEHRAVVLVMLDDPATGVQTEVLHYIRAHGLSETIPRLQEMLGRSSLALTDELVATLRALGVDPTTQEALAQINSILEDVEITDEQVLGDESPLPDRVIGPLTMLMTSEDVAVEEITQYVSSNAEDNGRLACGALALALLAERFPDQALGFMREALHHPRGVVVVVFARLLFSVDEDAEEYLRPLLDHPDPVVREKIAELLE